MGNKIDVFILTNTLKTGGAEKQAILLAKHLMEIYNVKLVIYYGNKLDSRYINLVKMYNLDVIYLSGPHVVKLWRLFQLFQNNKHAVIFSYLATTNLINGLIGLLSGIKLRVGGIRNSKLEKKKFFIQRFLHNYLLTASVFNNYSGLKELEKRGFVSDKAHVIPNCIHIEEAHIKSFGTKKIVNILTVSRFVAQKDYITALQSIHQLKNQLREVDGLRQRYIIIGFGELEIFIRKKIDELNLSRDVELIINPAELKNYFKEADIYLSTSLYEGLSNSIMEAMEFSLPVVATDVGDNNRLVKHGENGFLTKIKDTMSISDYLFELMKNDKKRLEMGKKGYEILSNEFSEEMFKTQYLKLINDLKDDRQ